LGSTLSYQLRMGAGQNVVLLAVREVAEGAESRGVWWIGRGEGFCYVGAVPAFVINVTGAVKFGGDAVLVMVWGKDLVGKRKCRGGPLRRVLAVGAVVDVMCWRIASAGMSRTG